jgi:hypothetical protein
MVFVVLGTKLAWPLYTLAGSLATVAVATIASVVEGRGRPA